LQVDKIQELKEKPEGADIYTVDVSEEETTAEEKMRSRIF